MARKLKHSKIKNTSILFELLTRQITADVLAGKSTKSVKMVKKYFNENTELGKELQLYRILSEKQYQSEATANDILEMVDDYLKPAYSKFPFQPENFDNLYKIINSNEINNNQYFSEHSEKEIKETSVPAFNFARKEKAYIIIGD